MRIALTGASGFIGSVTARRLAERGHGVVALVRDSSRRDHIEPYVSRFVVGDQGDRRAWAELAENTDAIIHNAVDWAPLRAGEKGDPDARRNVTDSVGLLEHTEPIPFVFVSSIATHHDIRPRWDGRPDEDHPLRPATKYGAYKAAVEAYLWAEHYGSGRRTSAVRPCGVYGLDPKLDRSHGYALLKKVAAGEPIDKPGGGKFVDVDDVAEALAACAELESTAGQAYNLVDCYARWGDWGVMACKVLGKEVPVDLSSPASPQNMFSKAKARALSDDPNFLNRGHEGIERRLRELAEAMRAAGEL